MVKIVLNKYESDLFDKTMNLAVIKTGLQVRRVLNYALNVYIIAILTIFGFSYLASFNEKYPKFKINPVSMGNIWKNFKNLMRRYFKEKSYKKINKLVEFGL